MKLWVAQLRRRNLLELLLRPREAALFHCNETKTADLAEPPQREQLYGIWSAKPQATEPPPVIIVGDDESIDFFAWTSTFLNSYRPFTAHYRVLMFSEWNDLSNSQKETEVSLAAYVGAVFGEYLTDAHTRSIDSVSIQALSSTFSYCAAKSIIKYGMTVPVETLLRRWTSVRTASSQRERVLGSEGLEFVWSILQEGSEIRRPRSYKQQMVSEAFLEIRETGRVSQSIWNRLTDNRLDYSIIESLETHVKDEAFLELTRLSEASIELPHQTRDFILGFCASLVGPALEYMDVLAPALKNSDCALIWYGVCAGLRNRDQFITNIGAVARRLGRDLVQTSELFSKPDCDISGDEFISLIESEENPTIARSSPSSIKIDLAPGISTLINWPVRNADPPALTKPQKSESSMQKLINEQTQILLKAMRDGFDKVANPSTVNEKQASAQFIIPMHNQVTPPVSSILNHEFKQEKIAFFSEPVDADNSWAAFRRSFVDTVLELVQEDPRYKIDSHIGTTSGQIQLKNYIWRYQNFHDASIEMCFFKAGKKPTSTIERFNADVTTNSWLMPFDGGNRISHVELIRRCLNRIEKYSQ